MKDIIETNKHPKKIPPDIKELILWKLDAEVPPNYKLSIGGEGLFTKEELKQEVESDTEIGWLYTQMQLKFLKDLASGKLSRVLAE
jgi:hypothetical protein